MAYQSIYTNTQKTNTSQSSSGGGYQSIYGGSTSSATPTPTPQPSGSLTLTKATTTPGLSTNIGNISFGTPTAPPPTQSPKSLFQKIQNTVTDFSKKGGVAGVVGRVLQKVPDTTLKSHPEIFKSTDTEKKFIEFLTNIPGAVAQSYGRSLETLSTKEGAEQLKQGARDLPKTFSEVKTHIENKEWGKAFETAFANPAVSVTLDVADFIPVGTIFTAGGKKALNSLRKLAQTTVKEGIQEGEEQFAKSLITDLGKDTTVFRGTTKKGEPLNVMKPNGITGGESTSTNRAIAESFAKSKGGELQTYQIPKDAKVINHSTLEKLVEDLPASKKAPAVRNYLKNNEIDVVRFDVPKGSIGEGELRLVKPNIAKSVPTPEVKPKPAPQPKAPVKQTEAPKTEPKTPSKIALSIERKAVEANLTKKLEDIAGYDKLTIKDQAEKASKLINSDIDQARRIIRGEEPLPKNLRGTALITAMEERIKKTGDADLVRELANSPLVSETSAAAQELRLAAEREPDSLAIKLRELKQAKDAAFKRQHKGKTIKQATEDTIKEINREVKKKTPDKKEWASFIKQIQC